MSGAGDSGVDDITVAVRVKPGASRTSVAGCHQGPHGAALVVAVNAPAVEGRATEAVRQALARALRVRPSALTLRSGAKGRDKLFKVAAAPAEISERVRVLRDGHR